MKEIEHITELIEGCNIPIKLNHSDCDPKNMIYNRETGCLTLVDYEILDTQIFTYDLGRYFMGYLGIPFNFAKLPDEARLKQFVRFYLEEKYKLLKKPITDLTDELFSRVFYWVELSYTFIALMFVVSSLWSHLNYDFSETPLPEGTNLFLEFTEPCLQEYYRMKEKLNKPEFKIYHK